MKISQLGEFGLIERLKQSVSTERTERGLSPASQGDCPLSVALPVVGIGDDAAVLPYSKSQYQLLTTDMLAEDVHFTRNMDAKAIGHKIIACSISDIAAMGGWPTFAVVSIGIPKNLPLRFIEDLYKGMAKTAKDFGVSIVGGDTIKSDKIVLNLALLGQVEKKNLITRAGAKKGDWIFVTGLLGGSFKSGRHLSFTPRMAQARFLVENFKPNAMMDISDGLAGDLNHILKASKVGAKLDEQIIPRHKGVSLNQALTDGEDFELLFTLSAAKANKLMQWQAKNKAFYFYPIGRITSNVNERILPQSFNHFV